MGKNRSMSYISVRKTLLVLLVVWMFITGIQAQDTAAAGSETKKGKPPIIIIPGLAGTELVNTKSEEVVWFKAGRSKDDDLRLPISPNLARNRDSLVPKDIIKSIQIIKFLPQIEIYERLIDALEKRGGYKEGKWDAPEKDGFEDTYYVFAYDWRRDNVENARLLIRKINALKLKLKKPNLKFNVIAHSMGGLLARYAAMYGNADLPRGKPRPTWVGARHLDKIFLLGTPNEGSVQALDTLLNGFSYFGGGFNLPFIQNLSRFDTFTIPSIYQLLPHDKTFQALDENLQPMEIDIYNPKTWDKYDWSIFEDSDFSKQFSETEQRQAKAYFAAALTRARRFQEALNANNSQRVPVSFFVMGADCKETQNSIVLYRDPKKNRWQTLFKASSFERENGEKVTAEEVKKVMFEMGDGVVTKRSLKVETIIKNNLKKFVLPMKSELFICETHNRLATNAEIKEILFALIWGDDKSEDAVTSKE
jgi:pimeloyl-ACP methyl ester carboxylesterase